MKGTTTGEQRQEFYERHQGGETYREIAVYYGVSVECIRYWCRRQRDGKGHTSEYHHEPSGLLSSFDPLVRYCILRLRLKHPRWGPSRILFHLQKRSSLKGKALPNPGQIGRYLHQWARFRRRPRHQTRGYGRLDQPTIVHQRWQVDFKMGIRLADGSQVNLHTVRDVVGAACIIARVTPAGKAGCKPPGVTVRQLQDTLRAGMAYWHTMPDEVQTDNEAVFVGDTGDYFPGLFTLWLIGLGIRHLTITPGKPTHNAEVERCHGIVVDYAVTGDASDALASVQQALDQAVYELAFELPSRAKNCAGQPPVVAYSDLLRPRRPFSLEQELALFDLKKVDAYLASFLYQRLANKTGQICLGGHHRYYSVGRAYAHQSILVCFDPLDRHFVFFQTVPPYAEIGRRPARGLDPARIIALHESPLPTPQQLPLPFLPATPDR